MKNNILRPLLVTLFFLLIFSPLFLMPFVEPGLSRGWQREFSIILGFCRPHPGRMAVGPHFPLYARPETVQHGSVYTPSTMCSPYFRLPLSWYITCCCSSISKPG